MKTCKHCGAQLEDEQMLCPNCGAEENTAPGEAMEEATPAAAETTPEAEPASEETAQPIAPAQEESAEEPAAPEKKKGMSGTSAIALGIALVVLLVAILAVFIASGRRNAASAGENQEATSQVTDNTETEPTTEATIPADGNPEDVTCKGSYTVTDGEAIANAAQVVATSGAYTLTNSQLQIHYLLTVQNFYSQYGAYASLFGLDTTQSLDTQVCGMAENRTWQQQFLEQALSSWQVYTAVAQAAVENDYQLSDEIQQELDGLLEGLEETAQQNGYENATVMLQESYGSSVTLQDYKDFWELYYLSSSYYNEVTGSYAPTDEEIQAYFAQHEAEYAENGLTQDTHTVDVRHILLMPEGATNETIRSETFPDEAWETAQAKAQEILDRYLAGDKTEDSFATLATEYSEDPGSAANGGLYTGVNEGDMVAEFNDWCFDAARQAGDTDVVKTSFGYHIMYYVGSTTVWQDTVRNDIISQWTQDFVEEAEAASQAAIDYSKICLIRTATA